MGFAAIVLWVPLAVRISHQSVRNSDNAWEILLGQDLLHGNILLRGWTLTPFTAWTSEVPVYGFAALLFGVREDLLYVTPVLMYAAAVALTAVLAATRLDGLARARAVLITVGLLALPTPYLAYVVLQPGFPHMGTVLLGLASLICAAACAERIRPLAALALVVLLAANVTGDGLAVPDYALPILMAAVLMAAVGGRRSTHLAIAGLATAGLLFGAGARLLPQMLHGFDYVGLDVGLSSPGQALHATRIVTETLTVMLGGRQVPTIGPEELSAIALVAGVALATLFVAWHALRGRGPVELRFLELVLVAAIGGGLAAAVLTTRVQNIFGSRYLVATVLLGIAVFASAVARLPATGWRRAAIAAIAMIAVVRLGVFAAEVEGRPYPQTTLAVRDWLLGRGLTYGYSGYWDADLLTVESNERLTVRAVGVGGGRLAPYLYLARSDWFAPGATEGARFLVLRSGGASLEDNFGVDEQVAARTFGPPDHREVVADYVVLVWDRPIPLT